MGRNGIDGGRCGVFLETIDGHLVALDGRSGKHLWHFQTGREDYGVTLFLMRSRVSSM